MKSLQVKQNFIIDSFKNLNSPEQVYDRLIELGQKAKAEPFSWKSSEYLVKGCQSQLYLYSYLQEGLVIFKAFSDALISMGLAQLLVQVYSGEKPEDILTTPPTFLDVLKIPSALTPNRANGLYHIHLKMKQEALAHLVKMKSDSK